MLVYRVASERYAPDNSEGARLYGGRWNERGTPVIYTASTASLAALEVIVHHGLIPADYRVVQITIPGTVEIQRIAPQAVFGEKWWEEEYTVGTAELGSRWARSLKTAVLQVPSAVIRSEFNYILNPLHPTFRDIAFEVYSTDVIDQRLRAR